MLNTFLLVVLAAFATFRCASIVTSEDGPFDVFFKLRYWTGKKAPLLAKGLRCYSCTSVWFGFFFGAMIAESLRLWFVLAFAISGLAIFIYLIESKFVS